MKGNKDIYAFGAAFDQANDSSWRALVDKVLKGAPFERLISHTADGITIQPLNVTPADGTEPKSRPLRANTLGVNTNSWTILARIDHSAADQSHLQALDDITNGADGLHIVLKGSSGAFGFGLTADDLPRALAGIDPATTAFEIDLPASAIQAADYIADFIIASGLNPASADIAFGLDPFSCLLMKGASAGAFEASLNETIAAASTLSSKGFRGRFVCADSRPVHAAGGSEVQELAYLLGAAATYLRAFEHIGIAPGEARNFIHFRMAADADQFLTVAKLRALRRLMARLEDACALVPAAINIHAETAWRMMTRTDPWVNILRSTIATFAAVTGGADRVSVLPHSQPFGLPDAAARRLARNLQLILREESHLAVVDDPAAGAGGIEELTNALCEQAWTLFQDQERQDGTAVAGLDVGGLAAAIASGAAGRAIAEKANQRIQAVATGAASITGTNIFPDLSETAPIVDEPIDADWADAFKQEMRPNRLSEPFEALRNRAGNLIASGVMPQVFLANLGPLAAHNARTNFAANFFATGGIGVQSNNGFANAQEAAAAFVESNLKVACICSSDAVYAEQAESVAQALIAKGASLVLLAGRGGEKEAAYRAAGIGEFVFAGCNMLDVLARVWKEVETGQDMRR